jgi:hypothetical protein
MRDPDGYLIEVGQATASGAKPRSPTNHRGVIGLEGCTHRVERERPLDGQLGPLAAGEHMHGRAFIPTVPGGGREALT